MSSKPIHQSLFVSLKALKNLFISSSLNNPISILVISILFLSVIILAINSPLLVNVLLCILILIIALVIYIKNQNFGETALTFILGLFTVFSIDWNPDKTIIFVLFFFVFIISVFMISSIKIAAKKAHILKQAAIYSNSKEIEKTYKHLEKICDQLTPKAQLNIIERAEIIRYFVFRKVPLQDIRRLLEITEYFTTISRIENARAIELISNLYVIFRKNDNSWNMQIITFLLTLSTLPCSPSEFLSIFNLTKKYIMFNILTSEIYLDTLIQLTSMGLNPEDIEQEFRKKFGN